MKTSELFPRITLVTPSYQQGTFIEQTIKSVINQNYAKLEYIVIDGGSTDETLSILKKYDSFLSYWVSEADNGQAHAINKGFSRSTGDIMGWLNSDDILLPNALWHIAYCFMEQPSVQIVTGWRKRLSEDGNIQIPQVFDPPTPYYLRRYCCIAQETTFWRRRVWERVGNLDESLHMVLDYDYWHRILNAGFQFTRLPRYLGGYREYETNKTNQRRADFNRELAILHQREGVVADGDEAVDQLGADWHIRRQFIESVSQHRFWGSYRLLMQGLFHLLENHLLQRLILILYRHYDYHRQSHSKFFAFLLMFWTAARMLFDTREKSAAVTIDGILTYFASGLSFADIANDDNLNSRSELQENGLILGHGWYPLEKNHEHVHWRWAKDNAQIIITRLQNSRVMYLTVEPSLNTGNMPLSLVCHDSTGAILWTGTITQRTTIKISIRLTIVRSYRLFLQAINDKKPTPDEPRNLKFKILELGWQSDKLKHLLRRRRILSHRFIAIGRIWAIDHFIHQELLDMSDKLKNAYNDIEKIRLAEHQSHMSRIPIVGWLYRMGIRIWNLRAMWDAQQHFYEQVIEHLLTQIED